MGLFKLLLTGGDDDAESNRYRNADVFRDDDSNADEVAADQFARNSELLTEEHLAEDNVVGGYDPERSIRHALAREATAVHERDVLAAQVGKLFLTIESLLRLLKEKSVIDEVDLRMMSQKVDLEDGVADGEYHPHQQPLPAFCPHCEAKVNPGKRLCLFCGYQFDAE